MIYSCVSQGGYTPSDVCISSGIQLTLINVSLYCGRNMQSPVYFLSYLCCLFASQLI